MKDLDCPFRCAQDLLTFLQEKTLIIIVDFHAEATSEKQAFGWYLDGIASVVFGTHTHVQTADERILPGGTAYITDIGMTGPLDGILGIEREPVLNRFMTQMPTKFQVARGTTQLNGIVVDIDPVTGRSNDIRRVFEYS